MLAALEINTGVYSSRDMRVHLFFYRSQPSQLDPLSLSLSKSFHVTAGLCYLSDQVVSELFKDVLNQAEILLVIVSLRGSFPFFSVFFVLYSSSVASVAEKSTL